MKEFFKRMGLGAAMGVAVIIPGVSGGTVAVLLNFYDKLIDCIGNLRKDFKNSVAFLLPLVLGMGLAFAAAYFPLKFLLERAPLPTVLLFVGLMVGSCPKMFKDTLKTGFKKIDIISFFVPLAVVIGICFIPSIGDVDLTVEMPVWRYFVLIAVGMLASCALVVPGVSGSMVLLIIGYYTPIFNTVYALLTDFGHSFLVLVLFAVGLVAGFFTVATFMKKLMTKFPRGTGWAIMGFVIGSIPAIFITFSSNFPQATYDGVHIAIGAILCIAGVICSYAMTALVEAKAVKKN